MVMDDLTVGTPVTYARNDPFEDNIGVPSSCMGVSGVIIDHNRDKKEGKCLHYRVRFLNNQSWWLYPSMLDLVEGPW